MDPRIELQPERTIIVLGPQFTCSLLRSDVKLPPFTYRSMKRQLLQASQSVGESASMEYRLRRLQREGLLQSWLQETYSTDCSLQQTPVLQRLVELQQHGALVVYLYPDDICEQAFEQDSLIADQAENWRNGTCSGIMHPFGVYTDTQSMLTWKNDDLVLPKSVADAFQDRMCVCVGFEGEEEHDLQSFLSQIPFNDDKPSLPFLLCKQRWQCHFDPSLCLPIYEACLPNALCVIGDISKAIGQLVDYPPDDLGQSVSLLMASKTEYVKVTRAISALPGVNFLLMSNLEYKGIMLYPLAITVSEDKFQEFWHKLLSPELVQTLVKCTVLAVVFNQDTFLWFNGGKLAQDKSSDITTEAQELRKSPSPVPSVGSLRFATSSPHKNLGRTVPRYTVLKHKAGLHKLLQDDPRNAVPPSILKRRLSLPPHVSLPPAQHGKAKQIGNITASPRQQTLFSKYMFRRNGDHSSKRESKLLRQLLQEEPKNFAKNNPGVEKMIKTLGDWTFKRRRNLFLDENQEWSAQIDGVLSRKINRWERLRKKKLLALIKKEEEEKKIKNDVNTSSNCDTIKHHLSDIKSLPYSNATLQTISPYLLSQSTLPLGMPMMYQTPFLSSYPLLTTLPVNGPLTVPYLSTMMPTTMGANLVLVSNGSQISPTNTISSAQPQNGYVSPPVPVSSPPLTSTNQPLKISRKRKNSERSSQISSLLTKKDSPRPTKQLRIVSSPSSTFEEKSDEEDSSTDVLSPQLTDNNQISLWQFLLDLILSNSYTHLIQWNHSSSLEFQIKQPREVAKLWSAFLKDKSLDYGKFKRALHYYCTKSPPILVPVSGKELSYKFCSSVLYYINKRYSQMQNHQLSIVNNGLSRSSDLRGSREVLVVD